jgi:inhibitor of cysteine peptidase
MKKILAFALVAALALTVGGCSKSGSASGGGSAAGTNSSGVVTITEADQGKTVQAKQGNTVLVSLPGNPSTGYTWVAKDVPSFLKQEGEPTFKGTNGSSAVGAPGTIVLTFRVELPGSGPLNLDYKRPWETTATPAKTFSTTVEAK